MSYVDAVKLKSAVDNILRARNHRALPHKEDALLNYLIANGELLDVGANGAYTFAGDNLSTAIGKLLSRQDVRDDFGIVAPGSKHGRLLSIPDGAAL